MIQAMTVNIAGQGWPPAMLTYEKALKAKSRRLCGSVDEHLHTACESPSMILHPSPAAQADCTRLGLGFPRCCGGHDFRVNSFILPFEWDSLNADADASTMRPCS